MYSNKIICQIIKIIDNNINQKITINKLCNEVHYNRYYIMKLFKNELKITINNYINIKRIHNSLKDFNYDNTILMIALKNGFLSQEYYSEIFKNILGIPPKKYHLYIKTKYRRTKNNQLINNIINLNEKINKINHYLKNEKPNKLPVKNLTIFK